MPVFINYAENLAISYAAFYNVLKDLKEAAQELIREINGIFQKHKTFCKTKRSCVNEHTKSSAHSKSR
jgi:hypothetical protein